MSLVLEARDVAKILTKLLNRPVKVKPTTARPDHPVARRALVNDDNALVAVLSSDLAFAHRSGAALALMPAGTIKEGDQPDEDLVEYYIEVANVLSRLVNEASRARVRIDPGLAVPPEQLDALIAACGCTAFETEIEGYGTGNVAVWHG